MSVSISGVGSITGIDQGFNILGGNVGIGTLFPENDIHIKTGSATMKLTSTDATTSARLILESEADSYGGVHFGDPSDEDAGRIRYYHGGSSPNHMQFTTDGTEKLRITSDGKIGINSAAPNTRLDVFESSASRTWTPGSSVVSMFERDGHCRIAMVAGSSSYSSIDFADTNDDNAGYIRYDHSDNSMSFRTNGTGERLRISSTGVVGIGTNAPVNGIVHIDGDADTDLVMIDTYAAGNYAQVRGSNTSGIRIRGGGSYGGGMIDFGAGLRGTDPGVIKFHTGTDVTANNDECMRIQANGKIAMDEVGSITDAQANLHVQGETFRVSNSSQANSYCHIRAYESGDDGNRAVIMNMSNNVPKFNVTRQGQLFGAATFYAGRVRSDADSPTNYYSHGSYGFHAYSGRTDNTSAYRSIIYTRAWDQGDTGDRNIIYYADSGSDTASVDIDADQKFGVKADGQVQGLRRWFSGRVESDEADPDSVYNSDRGGIYGYDSSGTAVMYMLAEAGGSSSTYFVFGRTSNNDIQWKHRTSDGRMYVDASATTFSGADYAEYFEWSDGNSSDEDRAGYTVVLKDEGKIGIATAGDSPSSIIGVISAAPAIIGDGQDLSWRGKWKKDEFGREITTPVQYLVWNHGFEKDENGNKVPVKQPDPTHQMSMENADSMGEVGPKLDKMIADGLVPQFAIDNNIIMNSTRRVYDPLYDETKKYVPREFRKEWSPVGLVGKLIVRKGQVMGDRWLKMKDINDQLEQWMVR